jgi:hypothetical protein
MEYSYVSCSVLLLAFLLTDSRNIGRTDRLLLAIVLLAVIVKQLMACWALQRNGW